MNFGKRPRQQSITRHREENPRLAELKDQKNGRVSHDGAERDNADEHISPASDVRVLQSHRQRLSSFGSELFLQNIEGNDADKNAGNQDIDDCRDHK